MKKYLIFLIGLGAALTPWTVEAQQRFQYYTGARQLGMGGAYTAVVNDETALLTNPAGLGKIRDTTVTMVDPELHGGMNHTRVAKLDNAFKVFTLQGLLEALSETPNEHWHLKFQLFPSLVTDNFGIGLHVKYAFDADIVDNGNAFRLDYTNDYTGVLGYCFRFFGGVVKLGVAGRFINRTEIHEDLPANSTNLEVSSFASEGVGVGADVGLILTAPVATLPALAIVARDVGHTTYTLRSGVFMATSERPEMTRQQIDVGLGMYPIVSNTTRLTLTAEYHDIMTMSEETDHMRRLHAGFEFNFSDLFFFRGGMNQRYWTSGIELASDRFQIQAATYGEDIGTQGAPREDRRWVGKFSFRF
jgi:hypothetical protein